MWDKRYGYETAETYWLAVELDNTLPMRFGADEILEEAEGCATREEAIDAVREYIEDQIQHDIDRAVSASKILGGPLMRWRNQVNWSEISATARKTGMTITKLSIIFTHLSRICLSPVSLRRGPSE